MLSFPKMRVNIPSMERRSVHSGPQLGRILDSIAGDQIDLQAVPGTMDVGMLGISGLPVLQHFPPYLEPDALKVLPFDHGREEDEYVEVRAAHIGILGHRAYQHRFQPHLSFEGPASDRVKDGRHRLADPHSHLGGGLDPGQHLFLYAHGRGIREKANNTFHRRRVSVRGR